MNEKRCLVCRTLVDENNADCPVCGHPMYIMQNQNAERLKKIQLWADEYRIEKLEGIELDIVAYSHEIKNGKLVQKQEETVKVGDAKVLSFDTVVWRDEKFARIETNQELTLTVVIRKNKKEWRRENCKFQVPKLNDFWYIGAQLTEGLGVRFVIGNNQVNVKTKSFALI